MNGIDSESYSSSLLLVNKEEWSNGMAPIQVRASDETTSTYFNFHPSLNRNTNNKSMKDDGSSTNGNLCSLRREKKVIHYEKNNDGISFQCDNQHQAKQIALGLSFKKIKASTAGRSFLQECGVCLDIGANCFNNNCRHSFHLNCIMKWSRTSNWCPVCRAPIDDLSEALSSETQYETEGFSYGVSPRKKFDTSSDNEFAKQNSSTTISYVKPLVNNHLSVTSDIFSSDDTISDITFSDTISSNASSDTVLDHQKFSEQYEELPTIIGRGTYATVYLGKEISTGQPVALKRVHNDRLISEGEKFGTLQEVEILKKVRHPHIVNLLGSFANEEYSTLVLGYVPGGALKQFMEINGRSQSLSETISQGIVKQIVAALHYLHDSLGVIHGDIKPQNIVVDTSSGEHCTVKLCDFGNAAQLDHLYDDVPHKENLEDRLSGTMGYMAPELLRREKRTPSCDMWSLGILLYEMLVGYAPFYPYSSCLMDKAIYPERDFGVISSNGKDFLSRLLEQDSGKRMTSKAALQHCWLN